MFIASQIIGLIQLLYLLVLLFKPGNKGSNRFGQDPKWGDKEYAEAVFGDSSQGHSFHQKQQAQKTYNIQKPAVPTDRNYTSTVLHNSVSDFKGTKLSVSRKPKN